MIGIWGSLPHGCPRVILGCGRLLLEPLLMVLVVVPLLFGSENRMSRRLGVPL